jgi:exosortase
MTTESATSLPSESPVPHPALPIVAISRSVGWLAAGVLMLLWAYTVYRLGTLWHSNPDYAYGWFVPLLCLALFWERWQRRPPPQRLEASTGLLITWGVLALTLLPSCLFLEVIPNWRFAGWAFAGAIIGITFCALYLIGGRSWVHHFAFPLLFFLIAVPWPTRIEAPLIIKLSHLNAALSTWAANWLGTPAIREGVVIRTGAGLVGVDEACSGIRSFQAAVMVALFLGELFRYAFSRRLLFLLGGVTLAFGCNVVRTTYLVRVCDLKGKSALNLAHDPAGFTILGITLAGLLVLAWLLRGKAKMLKTEKLNAAESAAEAEVRTRWSDVGDNVGQASPPAGSPGVPPGKDAAPGCGTPLKRAGDDASATLCCSPCRSAIALTVALVASVLWILAIEASIEAWFRPMESRAASTSSWSLQLPTQQPEFRHAQISDMVRNMLKYDQGQQAGWRDANGRPWQAYYLRWYPARTRYRALDTTTQARGHAPDLCLQLAGMTLQKDFGRQIWRINGVALSADIERFSDQGRPLHVVSCYWEPVPAALDYQAADSPSTANALRNAWHALQVRDRGRNEKCVLKIGVWGMETEEEAEAAFRDLLAQAIRT